MYPETKYITMNKTIISRAAIALADEMAKRKLRTLHSIKQKEVIEKTSWIDLCNDKIPSISISRETKAYHQEIHNLTLEILSKHEEEIFAK